MRNRSSVVVVFLAVACIAGILSGCGGNASPQAERPSMLSARPSMLAADYPYYGTIGDLVNSADLIIVGKVISTETRKINIGPDEQHPDIYEYSVASVKVDGVIKGAALSGDVVEIKQMIALAEQKGSLAGTDDRGIYFLETYETGVPASLLNPWQGIVRIQDGKTEVLPKEAGLFQKSEAEQDVVMELKGLVR